MNTALSSLSTFINIDSVPFGQHPFITGFMKGVFNIKLALPKYNFKWDVGIVITYISKIDTNSLKYLSQKLATLLVLLCGQRCGEILSVLDIRNLDLSENMCVIRIGDILKTSGPKNHIGEIKFHSDSNDLTICPLNCLRQYLEATKQHRQRFFKIGVRNATLLKRLQHSCFPIKCTKFLKTPVLHNTSTLVTASGSKQCKPVKMYTESLCCRERNDVPERYF